MKIKKWMACLAAGALLCASLPLQIMTASAAQLGDVDANGQIDALDAAYVLAEAAAIGVGEAGSFTEEELYAKAGNGVLITSLGGLHAGANAVTGDFSIESAGFMIRDGRLCEAVKSFTIAGNFFTLLKDITALSNEVKIGVSGGFTSFGSPSVLVREMSIAGK